MNNPVPVPLKIGAHWAGRFFAQSARGVLGLSGVRRKEFFFYESSFFFHTVFPVGIRRARQSRDGTRFRVVTLYFFVLTYNNTP